MGRAVKHLPNLVFMRNTHTHTLSIRLLRVLNLFAFSGKSLLHGTSACRWSRLVHSCSRSKKSSVFIRFAVPSCENSTARGHQSFWDKAQSSNNDDLVPKCSKHHRVQRSPTESNGVQHLSTRFIAFANLEDSRRFSKILEVLLWIAMIRFFGSWLFPSGLTCSHMFLFPTWCSTHLWQQSPTPASGIEDVHLEAIGFLCLGCVRVEHSEPLLIHFSHFIRIESGRASNILRTPFCQSRKFHYASLQSRGTIGVRQGEKSKAIQ